MILCISAVSVVTSFYSSNFIDLSPLSFFINSGERFINFFYLHQEPAFSFIDLCYCSSYISGFVWLMRFRSSWELLIHQHQQQQSGQHIPGWLCCPDCCCWCWWIWSRYFQEWADPWACPSGLHSGCKTNCWQNGFHWATLQPEEIWRNC